MPENSHGVVVANFEPEPKTSAGRLIVRYFDVLAYEPVWQAMKAFAVTGSGQPDELWVLQHEPVYTRGLRCKELPSDAGGHIPVVPVDRGGLMTYHGPGQLILYCLVDLKQKKLNIRQIVNRLEQAVINLLNHHGIASNRLDGAPGVYLGDKKIASIGLRVKNNRTYHGISVNFDMDLAPFDWINPCGFESLEVVQLRDLVCDFDWQENQDRLVGEFIGLFDYSEAGRSLERSSSRRPGVPMSIHSPA